MNRYYHKTFNMSQKHNNNTKIIIDSQNINAIGKVVDKDTNKELSEITQLIMIVNASSKNVQKEIDDLLIAGADPDLEINYYNPVSYTHLTLPTNREV